MGACAEPAPYPCATDSDCVVDAAAGRCEPNAYCSYPDVACEPGRRWGPFAGDGLADACTTERILAATYAGCAGPSTPPADCEGFAGPGRVDVDALDGDTSERSTGYLIFNLSGVPTGATVLAAQVELTAADSGDAGSDAAGRIVAVEPFTAAELGQRLPAPLPTSTPADAPGSVALGQTVVWDLDPSLISGEMLHLSIEPGSVDSVQYWSTTGAVPPRLLLRLSK
ncbi:MAG: hypothetical protein KUG77_19055 [Nannocystaceae bacterium]|nr:hypothetical protein [Nannocystaceae bacterium]